MIYYAEKMTGVNLLFHKEKLISLCLIPVLLFAGCGKTENSGTTTHATTTTTTTTAATTAETITVSTETTIDIKTSTIDNGYLQQATIDGVSYSLTVDLAKWEKNTSMEQIGTLEEVFWEVYPRLYKRFGEYSKAPVDVVLHIENEGYEIAEAWENNVHIHDQWLMNNPTDFDCFVHELAHVIQNGWDEEYLEYSGYIERFADYCRFIYAFKNGLYNDEGWELQTVENEPDRESSVRFLVWLDYNLSSPDRDFILNYFRICSSMKYEKTAWNKAWAELFKGTKFEGMSIDKVWELYASSDFAMLSSYSGSNGTSELLTKYDIRSRY